VEFLGKSRNVSLFPARLAKAAHVPLITAITELDNGKINFTYGPQFNPGGSTIDSCELMQKIISFIESEIKSNPSIWPSFVKKKTWKPLG
jgi:lauroyl/myristoyl acyltransferase